jgi:preprotein translocase subunit SecE
VKEYLVISIVGVLAFIAFVLLWRQGAFLKVSGYVQETNEELRKCTWPTIDELKGSTVVVLVAIAILGAFTVAIDFVVSFIIRQLV